MAFFKFNFFSHNLKKNKDVTYICDKIQFEESMGVVDHRWMQGELWWRGKEGREMGKKTRLVEKAKGVGGIDFVLKKGGGIQVDNLVNDNFRG